MTLFPMNIVDSQCLLSTAVTGNSDIALSSIDPLRSKVMRVIQDTGPVEIEATMTDSEILGFSKGHFYRFRGFEKNVLEIGLKAPNFVFSGPYKIAGRILIIPVTGEGTTNNTFSKLLRFYAYVF